MQPSRHIVVLDGGYASYAYEESLFSEAGYTFEVFSGHRHDRQGKMQASATAEGILIRHTEIDDEFLNAAPHLKAIVRYGVGFDNVDLDAARRHQVLVANVRGYANQSVSDHAIALMYASTRCLPAGQESLRQAFGKPPRESIPEFHEMTLGIIGLGNIGGTLCKKVQPLFRQVLASDPYIPKQRFSSLGAKPSGLDELLSLSDVVSLHCNLTDETRYLINAERIGRMSRNPVLINTARGPVVHSGDLLKGLQTGKIHSAGLDVYEEEPPTANWNPLLTHPRVIATGHYAWYSTPAAINLQRRAADNLLEMLLGRIPADCLNAKQ